MYRPIKYLIPMAATLGVWGLATPAAAQPAPDGLTDEELAQIAEGEAIEIFDERPDKPFDRDTEVRLTGEQLAARGATDLATALALLPDVTVRDAGRGGFNIDIRGARKGAVSILIDGVLVTDPYYGTFDVSTIPVTDIVQIRVSTTPQSPIDGPGGPGGVIEVLTRDAIGEQIVIARLTGDTLPTFGITGTARAALAKHLALRISASGQAGARDLELPANATVGEARRAATGAGRLEYRKGNRRIVVDGFLDDRHYIAPPSDTTRSSILMIDRETSARASAKADDSIGTLQLQGQYWVHYLHRRSRQFVDPQFLDQVAKENLFSIRSGGRLLATRPFKKDFRWVTSTVIDHEKALVFDENDRYVRGDTTMIELAVAGQYERKRLRLDAAAGLAMPFGVGADPWPEGKLVGKFKPRPTTEITATTGYKGRVPSLRERFDAMTGNERLGPEKAFHAELRAVEQRDRIRLEAAPYYRRTHGTIRISPDPLTPTLINLGSLDIYGVDLQGRGLVHSMLEVGGSYNYVKARSVDGTDDPLDRLPHHRFDAWTRLILNDRYSALVRTRYFGESRDKGMTVGGYTLVEANLTAQLSKEYLAVLRVDDALDVRPETRVGYHSAGRVISIVLQGAWQ
ncbi:MAG: TonB-dependent receptor [Myxococcales bacterium]|nr:TonB-dependent receptor [Myxococcales bacterium]